MFLVFLLFYSPLLLGKSSIRKSHPMILISDDLLIIYLDVDRTAAGSGPTSGGVAGEVHGV